MGNHWKSFTWLVFVCSTILLPGCGNAREEQAIRETFNGFVAACDAADAPSAAVHLSSATFTHWDRLIQLARSGTRAQIFSLPPRERLDVVSMRHRCSGTELKNLTGPFWMKAALERGAYMRVAEGVELNTFKIRGDFAEVTLMVDGEEAVGLDGRELELLFVKESGGWKYDLPNNHAYSNWILERASKLTNRDLNELILDVEGRLTGERPRSDIYDKPNPV